MVTDDEYRRVVEKVEELGFRRVFLQPESGDEEFVPDFHRQGDAFAGNERHCNG